MYAMTVRSPQQDRRLADLYLLRAKRKRKKRRKWRTPRSPRPLLRGRARRPRRQWHACISGFPGDVPLRAMLPSVVAWPGMLGIMAGVDEKDSGALIVVSGSDMCKARIAGFMPRYVLPLVVGRSAGMSVWTRSTFTQLAGFTGDDVPRAVLPFIVVRPKLLGIMASMTRGVQNIWFRWKMTSNVSVFSSLVRQWIRISVILQRPGLRLQLQFIVGHRHPLRAAEADPHGPVYSTDHRDSPVRRHGCRFPCCSGHCCSHSCISLRNYSGFPPLQFIMVVGTPFVAQMLISIVLATMENPQLCVDRAVDAPVMQVVQFRSSSIAPCIWQSLVRCSVFAVGVQPHLKFSFRIASTSKMQQLCLFMNTQKIKKRRCCSFPIEM